MRLNIVPKPALATHAKQLPRIEQSWTVEEIAKEAAPESWEAVFEAARTELKDVSDILVEQEQTYGEFYPLKQDIFAAFNKTKLSDVKLVIVGQDPYHQTINCNGKSMPRATGLAFSVRECDSIPSSLQNVFTELSSDIPGFVQPRHGDLSEWAAQGVFLINRCLTVRPGQPNSHDEIWLGFLNKVFKAIAAVNPYCVYLLWGREAQKVKTMIGERSIVLEAAHPSGQSARYGFFGCKCFSKANEILIAQGKTAIVWNLNRDAGQPRGPSPGANVPARNIVPVTKAMIGTPMLPTNIQIPQPKAAPTHESPRHMYSMLNTQPVSEVPIIPHTGYKSALQSSSSSIPIIPKISM